MRLHDIVSFILLLVFVVPQSKGKKTRAVPEDFREYMAGTPPPGVQVNPPKVWRRRRDTNQNFNTVENLILDAENAKDFAGQIDGAVH
mgnify:FL=1